MYGKLKTVLKENGELEDFDIQKIDLAILKSMKVKNEFEESEESLISSSKKISFQIIHELQKTKEIDFEAIPSKLIADVSENVLYASGYHLAGKEFMKFRYERIIESLIHNT